MNLPVWHVTGLGRESSAGASCPLFQADELALTPSPSRRWKPWEPSTTRLLLAAAAGRDRCAQDVAKEPINRSTSDSATVRRLTISELSTFPSAMVPPSLDSAQCSKTLRSIFAQPV